MNAGRDLSSGGLPKDYEGLAVFRETFLACLAPRQAAGLRIFAKALYELVLGNAKSLGGAERPALSTNLAAIATDLRYSAVVLRSCSADASSEGSDRAYLDRLETHVRAAQSLASRLDREAQDSRHSDF